MRDQGVDSAVTVVAGRRRPARHTVTALAVFCVLAVIFLLAPIFVVVASAFTASDIVAFPPRGLSLKWFGAALANREIVTALGTSLLLALVNAVVATSIGLIAAIGLAMSNFKGKEAVSTFLLSPLMLPSIVLGIAALQFFSSIRLVGTFSGLLLGHLLITVPYAIRLVGVSLSGFDWTLHRAATSLGAHPFRSLYRVVVPSVYPGLAAATTFCLILSFDEVTISLFLTGPSVNTLPVVIFRWIEYSYDPVIAAASALTVLLAVAVVVLIECTLGLERAFGNVKRR